MEVAVHLSGALKSVHLLYRGQLNVVVGIYLHQVAILYVAVQASDGKIRVKCKLLYSTWILQRREPDHIDVVAL